MFGLFAPRCPLDTAEKAWVERRMVWLADRFGIDRLRSATVLLPTAEFFPEPYTPDYAGCRTCLDRMCGHLRVDPRSVRLEVVDDDAMPGAAGLYQMRERSVICVAESQLDDPPRLLATLTHELAHELLLKGGHLTSDTPDHEQVTDLLPVFLGAGIPLANATVRATSWSAGEWSFSSFSKQGYLSSIQLGYALAVFAFVRGEDRPRWASHLRTDAAVTLKAGLRYLFKTEDCLLHPLRYGERRGASPAADLPLRLTDPNPTVRLNALWDLADHAPPPADLFPAVERCLQDRDAAVRHEAVRALGAFGAAAAGAIPTLIEAAYYGTPPGVRAAAASTLGQVHDADPGAVVPALVATLGDASPEVVRAAAGALGRVGRPAAAAAPRLLTALESAGAVGDPDRVAALVAALRAVRPDAASLIRAHFAAADPEIRRPVIEELHSQERSR